MAEERPEAEPDTDVPDRLEEWREADRDEVSEVPGSVRQQGAHRRTEKARHEFHDEEDAERRHQGDWRPRKGEPETPDRR